MMGATVSKEVVGFHYQEIPLEEAVNAVIAGDGSYAAVKSELLEALPKLTEGKAFAFGLPDGKEVLEEQRRGLVLALNLTLKKAKLPWRVTYSGVRKLFICVPKATPRTNTKLLSIPGAQVEEKAILKLWKAGMSVTQIIKQLGESRSRVQYVCYFKNPRKSRKRKEDSGNGAKV